ncbi:MAG TPA: DUF2750 domain-containing protein [Tepidisphaeraceae bacterium]|jgi:hypothetical protein|nr:DUF2750 domain-containing protein [Tepidisphaeraceae bacterium]
MKPPQISHFLEGHNRFISQVVANEKVWGLVGTNDSFAVCDSNETRNGTVLMFWSDRESAALVQGAGFEEFKPVEDRLFDFLFRYLPRMERDGYRVGTNFNAELAGFEIDGFSLQQQLLSAMKPEMAEVYSAQLRAAAATRLSPDLLFSLYQSAGPNGDMGPLRNLSNVTWSAVTHAHGKACDLPSLLRALVSPDPAHRELACRLLFETIWHQGDVYEATPLAIPFLYDLLTADGPQDKSTIALLISTIAGGHAPNMKKCEENPEEMGELQAFNSDDDFQSQLAREGRFMAELRRELALRLERLVPYLHDPSPGVRGSVAETICRFPEIAALVISDLETALKMNRAKMCGVSKLKHPEV